MDSRDYASDTDSDDEDFVPSAAISDDGSGSDISIEDGEENSEEGISTKKRRSQDSRNKKKKKKVEECIKVEEPVSTELTEEQRKERAKSLWADFLSDVKPKSKNSDQSKAHSAKTNEEGENTDKSTDAKPSVEKTESINGESKRAEAKAQGSIEKLFQEKENKAEKKEVELYEFAGETVSVEKGQGGRAIGGSGIASVLGQLKGGKKKLSTLEKSKLDWESFKANEGIAEDISTFNRGRHGFLERQDFLERADLRQFEIEKGMRASSRRSNR